MTIVWLKALKVLPVGRKSFEFKYKVTIHKGFYIFVCIRSSNTLIFRFILPFWVSKCLKGEVHSEMRIQLLSAHCNADEKVDDVCILQNNSGASKQNSDAGFL